LLLGKRNVLSKERAISEREERPWHKQVALGLPIAHLPPGRVFLCFLLVSYIVVRGKFGKVTRFADENFGAVPPFLDKFAALLGAGPCYSAQIKS